MHPIGIGPGDRRNRDRAGYAPDHAAAADRAADQSGSGADPAHSADRHAGDASGTRRTGNPRRSGRAAAAGNQSAAQGSGPLENGKVNGNDVSWSAKITSPMPMTLDFTGTVEGDKISGSVKAGAFGSFPFSGTRQA